MSATVIADAISTVSTPPPLRRFFHFNCSRAFTNAFYSPRTSAQGEEWFQVSTPCTHQHVANTNAINYSRQALKKYIQSNFKDLKNFDTQFNAALRRGVEKGDFTQPKGPSGPVKLNKKKEAEKKPKADKKEGDKEVKPKKAVTVKPKKAAADKEAKPKKAAAKKDAAPKKAPKEKAAAKPKANAAKKVKKAAAVSNA